MNNKIVKKVFLSGVALFTHIISIACTCIMTPVRSHIETTKHIVKAKVVTILDTANIFGGPASESAGYEVLVDITKQYKWRGKKQKQIRIHSEFSSCDIYFKKNEEYILFLKKKGKNYFIRYCSYSQQIEDDSDDVLSELDNYEKDIQG